MDAVGAIGPTAVERALLAHLDASGPDELAERLLSRLIDGDPPPLPDYGLVVHDAVACGLPISAPSEAPWGHLSPSR